MSILNRIFYKIRKSINDSFLPKINLNKNVEDTLIISGDPRGGTTWLSEIIMEIPNTALVWEPLSIPLIDKLNKHNFSHRQFIAESDNWYEVKNYFCDIFKGNIYNHHLFQNQSYFNLINVKRTHVKFCRANQLLPWLTNQFQFRYAPIYIIRHPCAVIASQLKQGGWNGVKSSFHIPEDKPYPEFYTKHEDFLKGLNSKAQVLAATWCLCNQIPLSHPDNNKRWITVTYESLVTDGIYQLKRIEDRWGITLPDSAYDKLNKASATTIKGSPIMDGKGSQLSHWKYNLSDRDIEEIMMVLDYFGIELYNQSPLPTIVFT
ncbi:sulfotransferase domain-containing protein [Marivirga arenosa]|uniref:Sulfotransferase domain-containing protein n=1 Tax=Marivirga arenosa TaxID=3059076 RepID=A0AA49GLI7_9BACT|nr:sulfotransferase domain-containing protein [Marivirga sp. ABR2-2]WKK86754.2 sulfotransferase domain-containing protein [Marivirga sp. ABR2-2]